MYYIDERTIEVEIENGDSVIIERNSKFYPYIQRLIEADKKLRGMVPKIQEENKEYRADDYIELYNSVLSFGERMLYMIEARALIYKNLLENDDFKLEELESGAFFSRLDDNRMQDQILLNELSVFDEFSTDDNPIVAFAKRDDMHTALQNVEMATIDFINELGMETPPQREYKVQTHFQLLDMEELTRTMSGSDKKTTAEIATEILAERGIDSESVFYLPLKQSIERGLALEEAKRIASERAENDPAFETVVEQIDGIIEVNNESIKAKHMHYNKYRQEDPTEIPEVMLDIEGNSYYDKILPLGARSVREAQSLATTLHIEETQPEIINESVRGLTDFVTRDNSFARVLGEKDEIDFEAPEKPEQKVYTPKKGRVREFLEKHKKGIAVGTLTAGVFLSLATGDFVGGATKIIDEIKGAVNKKQVAIEQKVETQRELDDIVLSMPPMTPESTPEVIQTPEPVSVTLQAFESAAVKERVKGPLESLIDNMTDEEIELYAQAMRDGNDSIKNYRGAYVIALNEQYDNRVSDEEFLRAAFKECDERIELATYEMDSRQLATHMLHLADVVIKSEIEEALDEKGMDVDYDDIDFYVSYRSNDTVRAYDIRLKNADGSVTTLSRSDHLEGTELDSLIRSRFVLERALPKVAVFDPNHMIANATQNCYRIVQSYMSGERDLVKRGEISDIKRENSKGFSEIEGDSMDNGDMDEI